MGRSPILLAIAAVLFLGVPAMPAQVFELSGGASTLYGAQGGRVLIHGVNSETTIGGGFVNGHFAAGGATTRRLHDGSQTLGQQGFSLQLPTDVFDGGHVFFGTGAGIHLVREDGRTLNGFAGLTAQEAGTPLFQTTNVGNLAAFGQWKQPFHDTCTALSTVLLAKNKAALESIECSGSPALTYAVTAGTGGGVFYGAASLVVKQQRLGVRASYILAGDNFQRGNDPAQQAPEPIRENITAEYRLTHTIRVSAGHQNYLISTLSATPGQSGPAARSTLDSASIQYIRRGTALHLTLLHSRAQLPETPTEPAYTGHNYAITAGLNQTLGRFQLDENLLHSIQSGSPGTTLFISGAGITLNPHLRLTEGLNITASGASFSHGGAFVTRFSSLEVGYQILYLADRPGNPFEQATVFDAQLRLLRDFWLRAASSISPTGATLYTFNLGTQFDRQPGLSHAQPVVGLGGNLLRGHVVDTSGRPVEGAAVQVGPDHLYTDSLGFFSYREKNSRLHPFLVLTDEFIEFGKFILVSAPTEVKTAATPDAPLVTVVVARGRFPAPSVLVASAKQPQLTSELHDLRTLPHAQSISSRTNTALARRKRGKKQQT